MPAEDAVAGYSADMRACSRPEFAHNRRMATPTSKPAADTKKGLERYMTPYYLAYVAVVGGITVGFIVLTLVIVLVATNFNVLGLIE